MNMKVENEMALPITKSVTVMLLEPYAGKLARTVLRGGETGNRFPLPDWHESDGSKEKFTESNNRFKTNGYTVAKANYRWWNPLRYIVMNHARRFGNICQLFGWAAWCSPCECAVCKKKRGEV